MWESLVVVLLVVGIGALVILAIKYTRNSPTLEGIAISALLGMLPLYLVLCFFGIMGEGDEEDEDEQSEPSD